MAIRVDAKILEKKVTALSDALAKLNSAEDFKKLILILRKPGWTTPAEFIFASSIVDTMLAHTKALTLQKAQLLKGSQAVVLK
ncbi:MAG: hypothetical protein WAO55_08100 [Candidatus Manganitrophaceae bacterium]